MCVFVFETDLVYLFPFISLGAVSVGIHATPVTGNCLHCVAGTAPHTNIIVSSLTPQIDENGN